MLVALGDDIQKRYFPAIGTLLIAANLIVFLYVSRLKWEASAKAPEAIAKKPEAAEAYWKSTDYYHFLETWGSVPTNYTRGHFMCSITAAFVHDDILRFLGNMLVLWAFVGTLEAALGPGRFFGCYIAWAAVSNVVDAIMHWGSDLPSFGAAGAIFGMIGAYFLTFGTVARIRLFIWVLFIWKPLVPAGAIVCIWYILTQFVSIEEASKYGPTQIPWYAHMTGFAAGMCTMVFWKPSILQRLHRDKAGRLHLLEPAEVEKLEAAAPKEEELAAPAEMVSADEDVEPTSGSPRTCPGCGTAVSDDHKIHANMLRCPNPKCQKLIMCE